MTETQEAVQPQFNDGSVDTPPAENTAGTEGAEGVENTVEVPKRRGRQRDEKTIARDERVFSAIATEGSTAEQVAQDSGLLDEYVGELGAEEGAEMARKRTYGSLWRLKNVAGRIERVRDGKLHLWKRV